MGKINWGRVFVGGLVTGILTFVFGGLIIAIWAKDFEAGITALGHPYAIPKSPATLLSIFVLNLVLGAVLVWLYAAIRPRYGPGPKTAAIVGFAMWLIMTAADVFIMSIGLLPVRAVVAPIAVSLAAYIVATEAGAWFYKE
jgi:hypothetical protein